MKSAFQRFQIFPHFLYLLPLFFVFHNYVQNRNAVTARDFFELYGEYLLATLVLFVLSLLLFKKVNKASVFAFGLMFFHLFFGVFHYALKRISTDFFLAKYSVLLPLIFLGLLLFIFLLKRTKRTFIRFALYLNLSLLVVIAIDVPALFAAEEKTSTLTALKPCPTCAKPDVYLIIADEYADSISLSDAIGFNNYRFQADIRRRGFHIIDSSMANYNFTQYAVASLFQMNYLPGIERRNSSKKDINYCYGAINQNELLLFFLQNGYSIKNFSVFNVANEPAKAEYKFVPMGKELVAAQTFLQRLKRDLGYHLVTTFKLKSEIARYTYYTRQANQRLLRLVHEEVERKAAEPRFVLAHFELPHYPYYYDRFGNERPFEQLTGSTDTSKKAYTEYLQYGNGIFLNLIDSILAHSAQPPVIVFMGDHGFREFGDNHPENRKYHFMNFNSVYLPGKNYAPFYKGLSGVNQFRAVMNSTFGQQLPYLKDSTILIVD